jgi:SPP1 family predicted phage head-tail adaptor
MKAAVTIGQMDRRITFQSVSEVRDDYGGVTETWSNVATVWAAVEWKENLGKEDVMGARITAQQNVVFTIRYPESFTPDEKMRVVFRSANYDIISISESGRDRFMMVECQIRN